MYFCSASIVEHCTGMIRDLWNLVSRIYIIPRSEEISEQSNFRASHTRIPVDTKRPINVQIVRGRKPSKGSIP